MPATQISFSAFAASLLASVQSEAVDCPPSIVAAHAPAPVVAHGGDDAGECIAPCADFDEWDRLTALANETFQVPYAGWSNGGYVLAALANCLAPRFEGRTSQARLLSNLRYHAAQCIGAGL
jgi:hypothetical protein